MDELVCLFQNARPGSDSKFQDEEVKNHLLAGLPSNIMEVVAPYLDMSAAGIARKYDIVASQRDALGLGSNTSRDKPLLLIQEKQTSTDPIDAYGEFEQVFAFRDGNRQNRFTDENCSYCSKKGHTDAVCFAKCDDDKMSKIAGKVSLSVRTQISAENKAAMDAILETISKMNLKG